MVGIIIIIISYMDRHIFVRARVPLRGSEYVKIMSVTHNYNVYCIQIKLQSRHIWPYTTKLLIHVHS